MSETRVKINSIVENQLPLFVREEFPLVSEFLSQYYKSLERFGGSYDILQNLDQYIKIDFLTKITDETTLTSDITFFDTTIPVESTTGFPDSYGLLLIDSEIITYTSKTNTTFEGCIRGFSGITSYEMNDELTFTQSSSEDHFESVNSVNTKVINLSILFLKEFLFKIKKQIVPGFENRNLASNLFLKQNIDFYTSKGTDNSFKILFGALYGENVDVIKPRDYLIKPSDAKYRITANLVVEEIEGDPENLVNATLYQNKTDFIDFAQGTVTKVEKIVKNSKNYYILSLDLDYDKDIVPRGTVYGNFSVHPKTKAISFISLESSTLEVDSTVGFPNKNGNLIIDVSGVQLNVTYESKTLNQFLNCSGIELNIEPNTEVKLDTFAYGTYFDSIIKVRILGVISSLDIPENTSLFDKNDPIKLKSIGVNSNDIKLNNWFFNIPSSYSIKSLKLNDKSDNTYEIFLFDSHSFKIGDEVSLIENSGEEITGNVISYNDEYSFNLQLGIENEFITDKILLYVRKNISKTLTQNYSSVNIFTPKVQNVYLDEDTSDVYVASLSLPSIPNLLTTNLNLSINDQVITFEQILEPDNENKLEQGTTLNVNKHGLYTGDSIVFSSNNSGISTSIYFVKKIDDTKIKLSRSRFNIENNIFVSFDTKGIIALSKIQLTKFTFRNLSSQLLEPQKIIRKISNPTKKLPNQKTKPGFTGIFVNGVELLNYKSNDEIFYGSIQEVVPLSKGADYDIINPPVLTISDSNGSGAIGHCSVIGKLDKISIIDAGFDYLNEPKVNITGGNGTNASVKANLITFDHVVIFNSQINSNLVKLNPENTIGFSTYHKFRDFEEVIYQTNNQTAVGGLYPNTNYFISVENSNSIKLYHTYNDAISGINTIALTSYGLGNHTFTAVNKKKKIGSFTIINPGKNYQNKLTKTGITGINTASNTINIVNHGYQSGEIVRYDATEISVGGLSSATSYYVTKIDENQFKLSELDSNNSTFYYDTKQFINLTSTGTGTHQFNYPEIKVSIDSKIGVSTVYNQNFEAKIIPVFRGEIESVFLEEGGNNYGSKDIINYNKQPYFTLDSGFGALLKPVILNGELKEVIILNSGSNYNSLPTIEVIGSGVGAVLTPIISNGKIIEVKVIYGGLGYNSKDTRIFVTSSGFGAKFQAKIRSWRINQVERYIINSKINEDDGILESGLNSNYGLEYTHSYTPRYLRQLVQSTYTIDGKTKYIPDLLVDTNKGELKSNAHSPIIGWAYDGNPIYGPYGYEFTTGGIIKCMRSSYRLLPDKSSERPSLYPDGFFIEDYEFVGNGDLDEHNGRFCITPEYPNGVYAYFTTINPDINETSGLFKNYRKPVFPYVIGDTYKSDPIEFNYLVTSNQDYININETNWKRNTKPYNLLDSDYSYDYITNINSIGNSLSKISSVHDGGIDSIEILSRGDNYKVGDSIIFDNSSKHSCKAEISSIIGKTITEIKYEALKNENIELIPYESNYLGISTTPHNLRNNDIIKFVSRNEFKDTISKISLIENELILDSNLEPTSTTGIITTVKVSGNLNFPYVDVNSIYKSNNEEIKVLNIDKNNSTLKIQRNINSTVGLSTNYVGFSLTEKSNKFIANFKISKNNYNFKPNKQIYFNSEKSVGIGTEYGVGITSSIFLDVLKLNSKVSIGTGSTTFLYFDVTKESNKYKLNDYVELINSSDSYFNVYGKKIVSIGATFITIDFDSSSFVGVAGTSYVNKVNVVNIPTKTIYLPKHNFNSNDPIVYIPPSSGSPISISTNGTGPVTQLSSNLDYYPVIIDENIIGISSLPNSTIESSFFFISSGSNNEFIGQIHSFKTNYVNKLIGKIIRPNVTVSVAETHGLKISDNVTLNVISGISTTIVIKYNNFNRRLIINPREIDYINLNNNTITINNHNFTDGQKVLYTSNTPSGGLNNESLYYVIVVDHDTIMLSDSYYNATKDTPKIIDITSSTSGVLSVINPPIEIFKNQQVIFDLSDTSLSFTNGNYSNSAFEFKLYKNKDFSDEFVSTQNTPDFDVKSVGKVGIDSTAKVILNINDNTPQILYYNLVPVTDELNLDIKKQIILDDEVVSYGKISIIDSKYNQTYSIVGVASTSFQITLTNNPESHILTSSNNNIEYYTDSTMVNGPIHKIKIIDKGKKYNTLPSIISIDSDLGKNSILRPISKTIGKIKSINISEIGYDYSTDYSIRPSVEFPIILFLDSLASFDNIIVESPGINYISSPNLVVIDSLSNKIIDDAFLLYDFNEKIVKIIKNTTKLNNVAPKIIPVNNSNGIKIKNIAYDELSKDVTITLDADFSDIEEFPFAVGTKILIEGTNVNGGKGYNSSNYNYDLFTISDSDPKLGGIGSGPTITYNLSQYLNNTEVPGDFNVNLSSGKVVSETHFPIFRPTLKNNNFSVGEKIFTENSSGSVIFWNSEIQYLKVSSIDVFHVNDIIQGESSNTVGIIKKIITHSSDYKIDSILEKRQGWYSETGFLNNNLQRIHDNDYYQYFSYDLRSHTDFKSWEDAVNSLNHTVGFKKFANLIVESEPFNSGISTNQSLGDFNGVLDLSSFIDLNCTFDFDLVRENNLIIDGDLYSNEISFNTKILQDYIESIGNRVLLIDDISDKFNSNPRPTEYSVVDTFKINSARSKKYIIGIQDKMNSNIKQLAVLTLIYDNNSTFLNQYGMQVTSDLGFFDFNVSGNDGNLLFYPVNYKFNDYFINLFSFTLNDSIVGIGTTQLGSSVKINTNNVIIPQGTTGAFSITGISTNYRSSKVLVQIGSTDTSYYEYNEITYIHDDNEVYLLEYGELTTNSTNSIYSSGIGTYNAYISGSNVIIDIIPHIETEVDYIVNTFNVSLSNSTQSGIGTQVLEGSDINSSSVEIASTSSPTSTIIQSYSNSDYNYSYSIISIEDTTNSNYEVLEFLTITNLYECYYTKFGSIETGSNIGIITAGIHGPNTNIYFTPKPNIEVDIKVFTVDIGISNKLKEISFINGSLNYDFADYIGTYNDIKKSFDLTHNKIPIFQKFINPNDTNVIDLNNDVISIPNHFYVTGEEITYTYSTDDDNSPIGIATTSIIGVGLTDKLPQTLYVVKVDDINIQVAASASEALKTIPKILDLTTVGIGSSHKFTSKNQNKKAIISIDNVIQSPITTTFITTQLIKNVEIFDNELYVSGISSFYSGNFIKVNNEIMKINSVGIGSTNSLLVTRALLGTGLSTHSSLSVISKVEGNYNIVGNTINFAAAPYGKVPFSNPSNRPDEIDYVGISTGSSFNGRVFLRNSAENSDKEPYQENYILDSISNQFDGTNNAFTLKSDNQNIIGISTDNIILLLNDVFQMPSDAIFTGDYDLIENSGITSVIFNGEPRATNYDVNTSSLPRGGIILSADSNQGLGYQPLISAGGTAIVSLAGTIQSISIGNSGSGYRSGLQSVVNVGVKTDEVVEVIGFANVNNGYVQNVTITNPGTGYTSSNPPLVIFDSPISYVNIPLIYSSQSSSGVGSGAFINMIVGQGSSVITHEITNYGYGYKSGEILTVSVGGTTGIQTTTNFSFSEFQLIVDKVYHDKFSAWSIGDLQIIDPIDSLFDGVRKKFPIKIDGNQTTIRAKLGSNLDVSATLLIFINDVLQVPKISYIFQGGSIITFTEAPKQGDTSKILFYRGSGDIDTVEVDILETIKAGDNVTIGDDSIYLRENERAVTEIVSSDMLNTNLYNGPGITQNSNLLRPLKWCKQTEDVIINNKLIGKNRIVYEPYIQPSTSIIKNINIDSTEIFVENIKTFFDSEFEYIHDGTFDKPQKKIIIIDQHAIVSASATAIVSTSGTVSFINLIDGGVGYTTAPKISISIPSETGIIGRAEANSTIINGTVSNIEITNGGSGYNINEPPQVLIESSITNKELIDNVSYEGDFGIITGVNTTSIGVAYTGIVFDFFIPTNSYIRDPKIVKVGIATTGISGIQTGYYFVVNNSNIGNGVTSLNEYNEIIGVGTNFIDNIYRVASVSIAQTSVPGVGVTYVKKVVVSVTNYNNLTGIGYSNYYGNYSWGKISIPARKKPKQFLANDFSGISTSPIVQRANRLKYVGYSTT